MNTNFFKYMFFKIYNLFSKKPFIGFYFLAVVICSNFSFNFINWADELIPATIVSIDEHAYPFKIKDKTYYKYYATIHIEENDLTTTIELKENIHHNSVVGDVQMVARKHYIFGLQEFIIAFIAFINIGIMITSTIALFLWIVYQA